MQLYSTQGKVQEPIRTQIDGDIITPFGPPVWSGKLDPRIVKEVQACIETQRTATDDDVGSQLAGRVESQRTIEDLVSDGVKDHILTHAIKWANSAGMDMQKSEVEINGLWVNYQQQFEYNPIHSHDGMFSFVFYTKNTIAYEDAINNQFDSGRNNAGGMMNNALAGHIILHYGETQFMNWSQFSHYPQEGDILIFPAWLNHSVHPFFTEGERISVAGNIHQKVME